MQKQIVALSVLIVAPFVCANAFAQTDETGSAPAQAATPVAPSATDLGDSASATLAPINNSGVNAHLFFFNDSKTLIVSGIATGLDPNQAYVSLVYNKGSVATGAQACLPTNTSVSWYQMVLAYWFPMGSSTRYLLAFKSAPSNSSLFTAFVPIDAVGTTSVRLDTQPGQPLPAAANPNRFQLQACGLINSSN